MTKPPHGRVTARLTGGGWSYEMSLSTEETTRQATGLGYPCDHCGEYVNDPSPAEIEASRRATYNLRLIERAQRYLGNARVALEKCERAACRNSGRELKSLLPADPTSLTMLPAEGLKACRAAKAAGLQFEALAVSLEAQEFSLAWGVPCGLSAMDPALAVSAFSTALQLWEAQEGGRS
jgi:hypothetical protein